MLDDITNPRSITMTDQDHVLACIEQYLDGKRPLTGLDFYYELERVTPLLEFHLMIRSGPQNRSASGLQQSYGDHNRLLMLAIDKLVEGDLEWFRNRLDGHGDVTDQALRACFDGVTALGLTPEINVALWLAGALHDCGMLCGRGSYVDVEDGIVLSRCVINALCPVGLHDLAFFVLHNHDYIKDVFLGEVPASLVARELENVPSDLRTVALAALGIVQVAGAASLGDGRLGRFRMDIFERCADGTALDATSNLVRLSRLLDPVPRADLQSTEFARDALATIDDTRRDALGSFLSHVSVHGWHRVMSHASSRERLSRLLDIVALSASNRPDAHIVLSDIDPQAESDVSASRLPTVETALSGVELMTVPVGR